MANEHDKRYKKLFSNQVLVAELLRYFVKEDFVQYLEYDSLERLDKSFITDTFQEKESDLIYKIRYHDQFVYIYLLIEFQSSVEKNEALRIGRYLLEFAEFISGGRHLKGQKIYKRELSQNKLPNIFPLLVYNGDSKWTAPLSLRDLFADNIPEKYIPNFEYYPIILNEIPKETLLQIDNTVSAIFFVENSTPEELKTEFAKVIQLLEKEQPELVQIFRLWINNLFESMNPKLHYWENINDALKHLQEDQTMFATALARDREKYKEEGKQEGRQEGKQEGKQEGRQEGRQEGKQEGKKETALRMLDEGFDIAMIAKITDLTEQEIREIKRQD